MVFAEFQKLATDNVTVIPMLGSDGVCIVDARKTKTNRIAEVNSRIKTLKRIHVNAIIGFKFFAGRSFTDCRPLYNGEMFKPEIS